MGRPAEEASSLNVQLRGLPHKRELKWGTKHKSSLLYEKMKLAKKPGISN